MRALILNSGEGKRMGELTKDKPKALTLLKEDITILRRQIEILLHCGIDKFIITTGPFEDLLKDYCDRVFNNIDITFVNNSDYNNSNYIYSVYLAREFLKDDFLFLHGDLVFEESVIKNILSQNKSSMIVSSTSPLPEKDFKAVVNEGRIVKIGVEYFNNSISAQPLYYLKERDWIIWLQEICRFINDGKKDYYAENAFNEISKLAEFFSLDIENQLCEEIDCLEDLERVRVKI